MQWSGTVQVNVHNIMFYKDDSKKIRINLAADKHYSLGPSSHFIQTIASCRPRSGNVSVAVMTVSMCFIMLHFNHRYVHSVLCGRRTWYCSSYRWISSLAMHVISKSHAHMYSVCQVSKLNTYVLLHVEPKKTGSSVVLGIYIYIYLYPVAILLLSKIYAILH